MTFQIKSRAAIMKSAYDAFKAGKTIDDCPPAFRPYSHTWKFEFRQAQRAAEKAKEPA